MRRNTYAPIQPLPCNDFVRQNSAVCSKPTARSFAETAQLPHSSHRSSLSHHRTPRLTQGELQLGSGSASRPHKGRLTSPPPRSLRWLTIVCYGLETVQTRPSQPHRLTNINSKTNLRPNPNGARRCGLVHDIEHGTQRMSFQDTNQGQCRRSPRRSNSVTEQKRTPCSITLPSRRQGPAHLFQKTARCRARPGQWRL